MEQFSSFPDGPFDVIAADPPWKHVAWSVNGVGRSPEKHYKVQPLDWICSLPVEFAAAKDCHLFLWITGPHLVQGDHVRVMEAWGFKPSSMGFVWLKPTQKMLNGRFFAAASARDFVMGLGHTTRQNAEFVVLGRRGKPKRHSKKVHQLLLEPRREHSRKPEDFYRAVNEYVAPDARKLEMFGRTPRPGWTLWGDEVGKFDLEDRKPQRRKAA